MRVLRLVEVERATGLRRSSVYERMSAGTFPRPIRLAARSVGWLASEVEAWVHARVAERDAAHSPARQAAPTAEAGA
jgi:prophage regulatory protein